LAKVQIVSRFIFNWARGHKKCFESHGWVVEFKNKAEYDKSVDLYILMWLDYENFRFVMENDVKNILFVRRYEFHTPFVDRLDWGRVDNAVVLSRYYARSLKHRSGKSAHIIYNGVVADDWTFKDRNHGKKIACVGQVNYKKNLPLAYQILAKLPEDYTLHVAGEIQSSEFLVYIDYIIRCMDFKDRVFIDGPVSDIDAWLEDKSYLLSTSISEGCPNNVIEAMAKGIKPVVHCWPGAPELFDSNVFFTVDDAVKMILPDAPYESEKYAGIISEKFGDGTYEQVFELAKATLRGERWKKQADIGMMSGSAGIRGNIRNATAENSSLSTRN
jgi:glycosyltransferase involved in cell wall biosynthesis